MSAREAILARIRKNRPAGQHDLPIVPDFTQPPPQGVEARFVENLKLMGGAVMEPDGSGNLLQPLRHRLAQSHAVSSAVSELAGDISLDSVALPRDLADVDVAVVRAAFAVAETGSVLLTEKELRVNALAYLAQHLVVLLDPADIVDSTQHAYKQPQLHSARYACFHSGPSATADIEGVLIRGAQGVRSLTVVMVPRGYGLAPGATRHDAAAGSAPK
jgi:L-lactate dehydrogenase complex protein LldG